MKLGFDDKDQGYHDEYYFLSAIKGCLSEFGIFSFGQALSSQPTPYQGYGSRTRIKYGRSWFRIRQKERVRVYQCFGIFITKVDTDTLGKIAEACDGRDSVSKVAIQDKKLSFKPAAVE